MSNPFAWFDRDTEEAEALAPSLRTALDPSAGPVARAAALAEIRSARFSFDVALQRLGASDDDRLRVARLVLEAALAAPGAPDLEHVAGTAVEITTHLGDPAVAIDLAARALGAAPGSVFLTLLLANARANLGLFDPAALAAVAGRAMSTGLRRRVLANLGVALLATGRPREALEAWRRAADDAAAPMMPDVAVAAHGPPAWIQRMRALLQLDGLGARAGPWGIGGPRMVVLLEGLAAATPDAEAAQVLRSEADARLRATLEHFVVDPAEPHVTLADDLADAAEVARRYGLEALAMRFEAAGAAVPPGGPPRAG